MSPKKIIQLRIPQNKKKTFAEIKLTIQFHVGSRTMQRKCNTESEWNEMNWCYMNGKSVVTLYLRSLNRFEMFRLLCACYAMPSLLLCCYFHCIGVCPCTTAADRVCSTNNIICFKLSIWINSIKIHSDTLDYHVVSLKWGWDAGIRAPLVLVTHAHNSQLKQAEWLGGASGSGDTMQNAMWTIQNLCEKRARKRVVCETTVAGGKWGSKSDCMQYCSPRYSNCKW